MANDLAIFKSVKTLREMVPGDYAYTLNPADEKHCKLLALACRGKPASIKKAANTTISVRDLVFYTFDKVDEDDGEVRRLPRLVVIASDGTMFSMSGLKAIEDVLFPVKVLGLSLPLDPPQKFKVSMIPCGDGGREYASLEWVGS